MNRTCRSFRTVAATGALALGLVMMPATANALPFGGGAPAGKAAQGTTAQSGAQTTGLLDWFFCTRYGKPSPC